MRKSVEEDKMINQYVRIHGIIREVGVTEYITKENEPSLASPEVIGLTRTTIDQYFFGTASIELFGEFGRDYVGQEKKYFMKDLVAIKIGENTKSCASDFSPKTIYNNSHLT